MTLFANQYGAASRRQLTAAARSAKAVDDWVRHGLLIRMHRGVYRLRGVPVTSEMRLTAAILRCGDDALAGPRTSAALHGLEGFRLDAAIDVIAAEQRRLSNVAFDVLPWDVGSVDRCSVAEIPCLTPAATLVELCPLLGPKPWRVALDSARRHGLTLVRLERTAERLVHRPGGPLTLSYIASGTLQPDGEGERRLQAVLVGFAPQPEWGVGGVVPHRRLDCLWREVGLALEYDGRDHHVLPTDRDSDGLRDLECEAHGIKVLRITKGMLDADAAAVRDLIERVYHRRLLDRLAPQS